MKMSPCKVHLGMFQYCLNITKLLNSGLIEPHVPPRSVRQCPEKSRRQKLIRLQAEGKPAVKIIII